MIMDEQKRYRITCPYCRKIQYACKSMCQEMGINVGHGICQYCYDTIKLTFDYGRDVMETGKF